MICGTAGTLLKDCEDILSILAIAAADDDHDDDHDDHDDHDDDDDDGDDGDDDVWIPFVRSACDKMPSNGNPTRLLGS